MIDDESDELRGGKLKTEGSTRLQDLYKTCLYRYISCFRHLSLMFYVTVCVCDIVFRSIISHVC